MSQQRIRRMCWLVMESRFSEKTAPFISGDSARLRYFLALDGGVVGVGITAGARVSSECACAPTWRVRWLGSFLAVFAARRYFSYKAIKCGHPRCPRLSPGSSSPAGVCRRCIFRDASSQRQYCRMYAEKYENSSCSRRQCFLEN